MAKYTREQLEAMTTNERLFAAGLLDALDEAIDESDLVRAREILESVYVDEPSISLILADVAETRS